MTSKTTQEFNILPLDPSYHGYISERINEWWGGRSVQDMLPVLFFNHFASTSLMATIEQATEEPVEAISKPRIIGFLAGFHSPTIEGCAYIHFVGVDPEFRSAGVGKQMYEQFFVNALQAGCTQVRCITSPVNTGSVAFHTRMGFESELTDDAGTPMAKTDYDGPGKHRISFVKYL